jgi:broad specificity phosphatase PhoE
MRRRDLLLAAACWPLAARAVEEEVAPWPRLREGGLVVLVRHASTEAGLGDPPGYRLDECRTQRNLSESGRAEARRLGERFREERVRVSKVYTSPWCRCRETARLAFGEAEDWEALGSFFDRPDQAAQATERVVRRIAGYGRRRPAGNVVMVTHNVNIAAITRLSIGPAKFVVVRPDGCCGLKVLYSSSALLSHFS